MNSIAIVLVLISCVMHAGWNLVCKSKTPSAAFFALVTSSSVVMMVPLYIYYFPRLGNVPPTIWLLLIATGVFQTFYYVSLGNAYRLNEMSLAYPITNSLPVLFVPMATAAFSLEEPVSGLALTGMIIIAGGCMVLPLNTLRLSFLKQYFQYPFLFVLLAALGLSSFSIIDSLALTTLRQGTQPFTTLDAALFYSAFQNLSILVFIWIYVALSPRERVNLRIIRIQSLGLSLIAGPVVTIAYGFILLAMQFASNVSYIVAFRQVSIVIGVLLGIFILKEKSTPFKITGTVLIFIGLVLAAVG